MATFRYWRLYITRWRYEGGITTSTGDIRVTEWELYASNGTKWPTSPMTGPSAPSPFVAAASTDDGSRPAYQVFNDDLGDGSRWISAINPGGPQWITIDLGEPVNITSMKVAPDSIGGTTHHIVDFEVHGSTAGAFAGEHEVVTRFVNLTSGWANSTLRAFSFLALSGSVVDSAGDPAARTVLAYTRSTGELIGSVTSRSDDGTFRIPVPADVDYFVVALPSSTAENALIFDRVRIPATDPDFASVALLLHLNLGFADTSPAGRTATVANVSITSDAAMLGGAGATSSTTPGQLLFASSTDFATDGNWTLEFNIRCTSFSGGPFFMAQSAVRYFNLGSTGELQPVNWCGGSAMLTLGARHHVAITHQADGTARLFLDGVLQNTSTVAGASGAAAFDVFGVPGRSDLTSFTQGVIDEVRWTKVCRYTATFTPPSTQHPDG